MTWQWVAFTLIVAVTVVLCFGLWVTARQKPPLRPGTRPPTNGRGPHDEHFG